MYCLVLGVTGVEDGKVVGSWCLYDFFGVKRYGECVGRELVCSEYFCENVGYVFWNTYVDVEGSGLMTFKC